MAKEKRTSVYFNREAMRFEGLTDVVMLHLKSSYPSIDLDAELKRMGLWLISERGKSRKGDITFISNWLNKAVPAPKKLVWYSDDSPLTPYLENYRKDLWKNCQHILDFNTIR